MTHWSADQHALLNRFFQSNDYASLPLHVLENALEHTPTIKRVVQHKLVPQKPFAMDTTPLRYLVEYYHGDTEWVDEVPDALRQTYCNKSHVVLAKEAWQQTLYKIAFKHIELVDRKVELFFSTTFKINGKHRCVVSEHVLQSLGLIRLFLTKIDSHMSYACLRSCLLYTSPSPRD